MREDMGPPLVYRPPGMPKEIKIQNPGYITPGDVITFVMLERGRDLEHRWVRRTWQVRGITLEDGLTRRAVSTDELHQQGHRIHVDTGNPNRLVSTELKRLTRETMDAIEAAADGAA